MKTKYLITGAAGNLGSSVTRELLSRNADIRALILPGDKTAKRLPDGMELFEGNILNKSDLIRFFTVPEDTEIIVIHLAGIVTTYWKFVQFIHDVNVEGTRNIVEQCMGSKVKKLVYISSVHAIPELPKGRTITEVDFFDPAKIVGFYGKTKAEASQIVMDAVNKHGLDASLIFPSGLCGPFDYVKGHVSQVLIDSSKGRLPAGIRGGFDFVDVRDVAKGIVSCAEKGRKGEGYILGNRYVPIKEILHDVHIIIGVREVKLLLPVWIVRAAVPLFEIYYKAKKRPPVFTRYSLHTLTGNSNFSSEKAKRELGYSTRPFYETIADALKWLKSEAFS
jgi:dihydroflavonol-4-reductase